MTPHMIDAAVRLADVLARENAALAAMDLAGAASMLPEKSRAAAAFDAAREGAQAAVAGAPTDLTRQVATRLVGLADENRRLLERGISVQGSVIGCILRAARSPGPPRYRANGAPAGGRADPVALSSRA